MIELDPILDQSLAQDDFKDAVRTYFAAGAAELIQVEGRVPRIKIRRLLAQLLSAESHLPIERVLVRARSGCSDFVGTVEAATPHGTHVYSFVWDCRWRAEQLGWRDAFGLPDQIRAAEEFDWQCFERWEAVSEPGADLASR